MYPYRRFRRARRSQSLQSAIWMIGLGILFLTGRWWPGILVLIGISMVVGALARGGQAQEFDAPPPPPPTPYAPQPVVYQQPAAPAPAPQPLRLPDTCPNCGAPTRSLRQRAAHPAECAFCGADLTPA